MLRHLLFSVLSIFFTLSTAFPDQTLANERSAESYSKELQLISEVAHQIYGSDEIYIAGGTARALIQHALIGTPFEFRDFDIVLSANQEVTAETARSMGLILEKSGLGKFSAENLRSRPRFNPALEQAAAAKYNAGFGFYMISQDSIEFDISVFHSEEALNLNGILDVDKIRIKIGPNENLAELISDKAKFLARIHDPAGGLDAILRGGIPKIVKWEALKADPTNVTIRVIRGFAKFNALPVDEFQSLKIRNLLQADKKGNPLQMSRNLLKLLEDKDWAVEYRALVDVGLFSKHFKSFTAALESPQFQNSQNINERVASLLEAADKVDALQFLKLLANLEPDLVKNVLPRLIRTKGLKVGFFTGEFAPFHKGHLGVAQTALEKGGLDIMFVIPTPHATNDPKTKAFSRKEWEERRAFVQAGLSKENRAWLWPFQTNQGDKVKLSEILLTLEAFVAQKAPLTHVFGMDSFYRVLERNLEAISPRPRIAVTRPGVPLPHGAVESKVAVLENIYTEPVSATRILHQMALSGTSEHLSPEVLNAVKTTPRYLELMERFRRERDKTEKLIRPIDDIRTKTLIWDPRENHAGHFSTDFPEFNSTHRKVLDHLTLMGAKRLIVLIEAGSPARISWELEIKKRQSSLDLQLSENYEKVKAKNLAMVVHSGFANESLLTGYFSDYLRGQTGLILYQTADQPISPLIQSMRTVTFINSSPHNSCRDLFSASGF